MRIVSSVIEDGSMPNMDSIIAWIRENISWLLGGGGVVGLIQFLRSLFSKQPPSNSSLNHQNITMKAKAGKSSSILQVNGNVNIGGNDDRRQQRPKN